MTPERRKELLRVCVLEPWLLTSDNNVRAIRNLIDDNERLERELAELKLAEAKKLQATVRVSHDWCAFPTCEICNNRFNENDYE